MNVIPIDAEGRFAGYASVFNRLDSGGDIVLPGAFARSLAKRRGRIRLLFQHDPKEPVGIWDSIAEDGHGLFVTGRLVPGVPRSDALRRLIETRALDGLSIGFRTVKANRIPQLSVEVCRTVGELEPAIQAVTVIPGATEFGYDPVPRLRVLAPGEGVSENAHLAAGISNWTWSIDELLALCPNLKHVALVVSWFGDDLRCGQCKVQPRVEGVEREIEGAAWSVAGHGRAEVPLVSRHGGGPAYGGTPDDAAVRAAIADLKARGLGVTLYPLMMMDIAPGNGRTDPYGGQEQAAYPWRGRITCHPAPGEPGSPDGTANAAAQVAAFVPGYRTMVLHYADMARESGGVDAILIGSEMRGLTTIRGPGNSFPFVSALVDLADDVRAIVGSGTKISYAADWSEYSGHQPAGEKFFHLDPLWASANVDAIGIDNYMPLSDWRDGDNHADRALAATGYELDYLAGNIAGGEGYDWFYASEADRLAQRRTPIGDGLHGEPWIWRYKDLYAFWSEPHHDRPGGVRNAAPTAWLPRSKPIWLTELGCGAVDKGANQPNIFGDAKSAEGGRPYFSSGLPDGLIQRQFLRAHLRYWRDPAHNPVGMLDPERIYCWTWDARPFPSFPALDEVWSDGPNHATGHWLTGRLGAMASDELAGAIAADHDCTVEAAPAGLLFGGMVINGPGSAREAIEPVLEMSGQVLAARQGRLVGMVQGSGPVAVLDPHKLADIEAPVVTRKRGDAAEKPGRLALGHFDRERDYLAANAMALRPGRGPHMTETFPMVLDGANARRAAERLLDRRAAAQDRVELALPPGHMALEPGDRIALPDLAEGPFEIAEIRDGMARRIVASAVPRKEAVATGQEGPRGLAGVPPPLVAPVMLNVHLPALPDDPLRSRMLIGAYARPWPGVVRVIDEDSGAVLTDIIRPMVWGETLSALAPGPIAVWDRGGTLEIALRTGHLADLADREVLAGGNRVAVETDAGNWEVIGFAEAALVAPGRYRLRRLLRGCDGTDALPGLISAGRRVMVLDGRAAALPIEAGWIDESRTMRCFAGAADRTGRTHPVSPGREPALPLPPVHLRGARLDDGKIRLSWIRRSRAGGGFWGVAEPVLEHAPEAWQVAIFDGSTLVRRIETASAMAEYGATEQSADFGGPATDFTFTIAQVSPVLGPGLAASGAFHG